MQRSHALNALVQLSHTLNALVLRLRALNALAQHAMNMRFLLQIYQGMYECACLTVNLHVSCTVAIKQSFVHTQPHTLLGVELAAMM